MKLSLLLLLLAVLSVTAYVESSLAAPQLVLTIAVNVQMGDKEGTMVVRVTGKVMDPYNRTAGGAAVSYQLTDPSKSSLHVSIVYSKGDGTYSDEFLITKPVPGNYTISLKASKPGYEDKALQVPFSLISGEFTVKVTPSSRILKQGQNGSFEIAVVPIQGDEPPQVSLKMIGLPQRITYNLLNKSATNPKLLILTLITREDTPVGRYNFTIIGEGKGYSHSAWAVLEVIGVTSQTTSIPILPETTNNLPLLPILVVVIGIVASFVIYRELKARGGADEVEETQLKPGEDREYLAIARALTRLEELRATEKIVEYAYQRLRKEYEEKLEKAKRKD
jgi:hypothetical protein